MDSLTVQIGSSKLPFPYFFSEEKGGEVLVEEDCCFLLSSLPFSHLALALLQSSSKRGRSDGVIELTDIVCVSKPMFTAASASCPSLNFCIDSCPWLYWQSGFKHVPLLAFAKQGRICFSASGKRDKGRVSPLRPASTASCALVERAVNSKVRKYCSSGWSSASSCSFSSPCSCSCSCSCSSM